MKIDTLFPEVPEQVIEPTQEERDKIAVQLISIWDDPPEVIQHWELDGKIVKEDTPDAVEVKTKVAHHALGWRLRRALDQALITKERRTELGTVKFKFQAVDEELFRERDEIVVKIEQVMNSETPPKDKTALDSLITERLIPVSTFTKKYIDAKAQKSDATFEEFGDTYKVDLVQAESKELEAPE